MAPSFVCEQGDAREEAAYARVLGEGMRADLLLTDPPYCLLVRRRKGGDLREPKDRKIDRGPVHRFESVRDYRAFTEAWLPKAVARLSPTATVILWTNFLGKEPLLDVARASGYGHLAHEFTWAKRTGERGGAAEEWLRVYEVGLVLHRGAPAPLENEAPTPPTAVVGGYDDDGEGARWGSHPNHKPFSVVAPLVRFYSRVGEQVLDPFAGSGSIPEAALRLGRRAACLELEPEWAARVRERLGRVSGL